MFDVYVFEAHPQTSMEGLNFRDIKAARTMDEKIKNYELYINDHKGYGECKVTIPGLLDNMNETWRKNRTYGSYYTSIWVINKQGKFEYTVYFAHPTYPAGDRNCYKHLEPCLDTLASQTPIVQDFKNMKIASTISYTKEQNKISLVIPDEGRHEIQLISLQGKQYYIQRGVGSQQYTIPKPLSAGKYLLRVITDKQSVTIPTLMYK